MFILHVVTSHLSTFMPCLIMSVLKMRRWEGPRSGVVQLHILPAQETSLTSPLSTRCSFLLSSHSLRYTAPLVTMAAQKSSKDSMTLGSICLWRVSSPSRSHHRPFVWPPSLKTGSLYTPRRTSMNCNICISVLPQRCLPDHAKKIKKINLKNQHLEEKNKRSGEERCSDGCLFQ